MDMQEAMATATSYAAQASRRGLPKPTYITVYADNDYAQISFQFHADAEVTQWASALGLATHVTQSRNSRTTRAAYRPGAYTFDLYCATAIASAEAWLAKVEAS